MNYQFPWYQGLNVELINKAHLRQGQASTVGRPSPRPSTALPALCETLIDKAGDRLRPSASPSTTCSRRWSTRATSRSSATTARSSPSTPPRRRLAADVRGHGQGRHRRQHRPDDHRRPRRPQRSSRPGRPPFYATGPNLIRDVKDQQRRPSTATSAWSRSRSASPASSGKGLMSHLRQGRHQVPERVHGARPVLHQPAVDGRVRQDRSRSTRRPPSAFDDPFFSSTPVGDRGQRPAAGRRASSRPTPTSCRPSRRRPTSTRSSARRSSRPSSAASTPQTGARPTRSTEANALIK